MSDNSNDHGRVERPRHEPEIIPPGRDGGARGGLSGAWVRIDESDGVRRIHITRPGPFSIILGLLVIGLIAAVIFLLLAGIVLIWVPVVIALIAVALLSGTIKYYWRRLRGG